MEGETIRIRMLQEGPDLAYGAEVKGRRCMCPSCPCSEVPKPALPERGEATDKGDVYINFSQADGVNYIDVKTIFTA